MKVKNRLLNFKDKYIVIFLGLDGITPEQLLKTIREHDTENDWTFKKPDDWMLKFCENVINESEKLKQDCEKLGFYYFLFRLLIYC